MKNSHLGHGIQRPTRHTIHHVTRWVAAACLASACGGADGEPPSTVPTDSDGGSAVRADASAVDASDGPPDASGLPGVDAGLPDAAALDGGRPDATPNAADAAMALDASGPAPDASVQTVDAGMGRTEYPPHLTQSPITPQVAAHLRQVVASNPGGRATVFAKVGASNTVNTGFLHCFAGSQVDLDGRTHLQATWQHFRSGMAAGTSPYDRVSLAATVGWSAWAPLMGNPTPLQQELDAIHPSLALVMFGTNDIQARDPFAYADNLMNLVDVLLQEGVVPILSTVPPRDDDPAADAFVPRYNAVVRAVGQQRLVPVVDLHRELMALPDHGIGTDGLHMNVYRPGGVSRGCVLTQEGLQHGFNMRNLVTLTALQRVVDALAQGAPAPDAAPAPSSEDGSRDHPFVVGHWPYVSGGNTLTGGFEDAQTTYSCAPNTPEGGRALTWRFTLDEPATVRIMVMDRGNVDIDVHLLDATAQPDGCVARAHKEVVRALEPGTWHVSMDTFVSGGTAQAGEFLMVMLRE